MKRFLLVMTLICWASPVFGQSVKVGVGVRSCAQFAEDYRSTPELMEVIYFSWAQGYLTGINIVTSTEDDQALNLFPPGFGEKAQKEFVREYCAMHPLAPYSEAVAFLRFEVILKNAVIPRE